MAFDTIEWKGRGVIANCNALSDSAGGTWAELGGGGISANTDNYLLPPASIGHVYASKSGFGYYTTPITYNFDTGGAEEGQFIYIWVQIQSASAFDLLANNGFSFVVGTDTSNYRTFKLAGSGAGEGKPFDGGGWKLFVFDPTIAGSIADVGSFNLATINMIGLWMDTIVSVRADTIFIDQISIGKGLQVTGAGTMSEIIDYCTDYSNRAWGVFQKRGSIGFAYGSLTIGDNVGATINTSLTDDGSVVEFGYTEFWNGSAWALTHPSDYNQLNIEKHASFTTDYDTVGLSLFGSLLSKLSLSSDVGATYSHVGGALKLLPVTTYKSGDVVSDSVYSDCEAIRPNGATFNGASLNNTLEVATGALELLASSDLNTMANISFNEFTGKYALYIPASITGTITLNNFISDGSGVDVYWEGTGGTLIINKSNGTNFSTWDSAGGTVSIVSSVSIDVNIKNQAGANIQNTLVYIDEDLEVAGEIINTLSDVDGNVSTSYSGVATTATIRARLYGYKPSVSVISLLSDSSTNVVLIADPQQSYIGINMYFSGVVNITDVLPHTITMVFTKEPKASTMTVANITQQVEDNGTISNIAVTGNPLIWTFDYTADASVDDTTNHFQAGVGITDLNDVPLASNTISANFSIYSSLVLFQTASPFVGGTDTEYGTGFTPVDGEAFTYDLIFTTRASIPLGDQISASENSSNGRVSMGVHNSNLQWGIGTTYNINTYPLSALTQYKLKVIYNGTQSKFMLDTAIIKDWGDALMNVTLWEVWIGARNVQGIRDRHVLDYTIDSAMIRSGVHTDYV